MERLVGSLASGPVPAPTTVQLANRTTRHRGLEPCRRQTPVRQPRAAASGAAASPKALSRSSLGPIPLMDRQTGFLSYACDAPTESDMTEAIAFDTHRFVKRLTDCGSTEQQAETLSRRARYPAQRQSREQGGHCQRRELYGGEQVRPDEMADRGADRPGRLDRCPC